MASRSPGRADRSTAGRRPDRRARAAAIIAPPPARRAARSSAARESERVVGHAARKPDAPRQRREHLARDEVAGRLTRSPRADRRAPTKLGRDMPGAAFACRKRCTRPRRFVNVPSSSAMVAIGRHDRGVPRASSGASCRSRSPTGARDRGDIRGRAASSSATTSTSPACSSASGDRARVKPSISAPRTFAARSARSARSWTPGSGASGPVATRNTPCPPVRATSCARQVAAPRSRAFGDASDVRRACRRAASLPRGVATSQSTAASSSPPDGRAAPRRGRGRFIQR